jgi:two-component system phosphate regulon sensor histidine kinase PhoR
MVTELLDLARIESGGSQLLLDDVDLGRLVMESVERLRPFAERQGITLEVDVAAGLPLVRGEASRLGQVLVNLVHNAIKFSPTGQRVEVHVVARDGEVAASVTDHGIGIAAADLPRVFERFYKADRSRTSGGGTGLGLAIARHIVDGHGGRLTVESTEGAGATFTMTLPAASPAPTTR